MLGQESWISPSNLTYMLVHRKQGRWCTFLCIHVHAKLGSASERTEGQAKQLLNTFSSFQSSVKIYWMEKTMKICTTAFDISEMKILKNWKYASNSLGGWCRVDLHLHENHILTAVLWVWPADFCSSVSQHPGSNWGTFYSWLFLVMVILGWERIEVLGTYSTPVRM